MTAVPLTQQPLAAGDGQLAWVHGKAFTQIPKDLYIPPHALAVILEPFEGPLDLLLYLIRKQNLDILDIDVSELALQYVRYVDTMESLRFELAADYLVMAAMLAEIKSRMLLPRTITADAEEEDPRAELIRRLREYERFKQAAETLDTLPRLGRDIHPATADMPHKHILRKPPPVSLEELLSALQAVFLRADRATSHHITPERLSTRERMAHILERLGDSTAFTPFAQLFSPTEGRLGVVVTFLAIMELLKAGCLDIIQAEPFGPIHVKGRGAASV